MSLATRIVSRLCAASGLTALAERRLLRRRSTRVTILAYHRVGVPGDDDRLDPEVLNATPAGLEWQLGYLRRWFEVIPLDEIVARAGAGRSVPANAAVVTFDDGYRDNFELAYPILRRLALPATIYLTTGYVGSTSRFWWDDLAAAIGSSRVGRLRVPDLGELPLGTPGERRRLMARLRRQYKALPDAERRRRLQALLHDLGATAAAGAAERVCLTWEEVREMARHGVSFGAHTHSHPILTRLPAEEAEREIALSAAALERELGEPTRHFAYPNGQRGDFDERTRELLVRQGIRTAVTLVPGSNPLADPRTDLLALRRYYIATDDRAVFAAKISGALELLSGLRRGRG